MNPMTNLYMGTQGGLLAFLAVMVLGAGCTSPGGMAEGDEEPTGISGEGTAVSASGSEVEADGNEDGTSPSDSDKGDAAASHNDTESDTDTAEAKSGTDPDAAESGSGTGTTSASGAGAQGGLANATARTPESSRKTETETEKTVTVKVLSDGWSLLPLLRTKVTAEDEGKHLVEVFSRAPGPDWEIQLRPREPSTSKTNLWKEYEIVGKPPENAKEASPVERKAEVRVEFPEETASVIIYGTDRRGEEVSLIEPVR